jgi:hypothetical protein
MTMIKHVWVVVALAGLGAALIGCHKSDDGGNRVDAGRYVTGFAPPPVADGYTRYVTPVIHGVAPGEDKMFCQWVEIANVADVDLLDIHGYQSVTGHHAVLYSSSENEPVGTSRECTTDDMVSVEFLGGIGGEGGGNSTELPAGLVFRVRKGRTLMANVHYLNTTDQVQDVQSVLDVKTGAPSDAHTAVGLTGINTLDFSIPPNTPTYTFDAYCTYPQEASIIMWSNHMHASGVSAYSEIKHVDGTVEPMIQDTAWRAEQAFNPTWKRWEVNAPAKIHAGDQLHISCTWSNATSTKVRFPEEMCAAVGFYLDDPAQLVCAGTATGQ